MLLKQAFLTLLAFQLIADAEQSAEANTQQEQDFEAKIERMAAKIVDYGLSLRSAHSYLHDIRIQELIIGRPNGLGAITSDDLHSLTLAGELYQPIANVGQSLVLLAEPQASSDVGLDLAKQCLQALGFPHSNDHLYLVEGKLFGSPIFEYQGYGIDASFQHLWLWFDCQPQTKQLIQKRYQEIKNLLCYRSKNLFTFQQAKMASKRADLVYLNLKGNSEKVRKEVDVQELPDYQSHQQHLEQLKYLLKEISKLGFDLFEEIRHLQYSQNTIKTNNINYLIELELLQAEQQPGDNLDFLYQFSQRSQKQLLKQVETNLDYVTPSYNLANQTIAVIRGYIEIEQAKCDRRLREDLEERERKEAEHNRTIQDTIEAIGIGVGVGAVIASQTCLMVEPWSLPFARDAGGPHPFLVGIFISTYSAWFFYQLARKLKAQFKQNQPFNWKFITDAIIFALFGSFIAALRRNKTSKPYSSSK